MQKLLLGIPQAAEAIGCGRSYLYELIGEGRIETVKLGKRRLVVAESVQAFVASLRATA